MFSCAAIGDSIAVGVGQARPDCVTTARVGITSTNYIASLLPLAETGADTTIISLGVNDGTSADTLQNLRLVRDQVHSRVVYWLLPGLKEPVREDILRVAREHGDQWIDTRPYVGRDHLHPSGAGYGQIASQTYGDGPVYAARSAPDEVAEAPTHLQLPDDPAFRSDYAQILAHHAARYASVYPNPPRRLPAWATPRERIHNLRATRVSEASQIRYSYSYSYVQPASHFFKVRAEPRGTSAVPAPPAASRGRLTPHGASVVRVSRTAQPCGGARCGLVKATRG